MNQSTQTSAGTSFHGDEFLATYNDLVKHIGPPSSQGSGDGKVRYEWTMETEDGEVFTIYDWKEPFLDHDQYIYWHIGAQEPIVSRKALLELKAAFA